VRETRNDRGATMTLDPLLPIAPARVRALVVPIGQIRRERFATFVDRLNSENVVYLRDITADGRPHRSRDMHC
jgi:trafficking protein particle complex subunit 9